MVYLSHFSFPDEDREYDFRVTEVQRTCHNNMYPFFVLSQRGAENLEFEPITILYGGNGSGKTTALNVIAEKIGAEREAVFNRSVFFGNYVGLCGCGFNKQTAEKRIITSDDVFDYMLTVRCVNEGIDARREELYEEYVNAKFDKKPFRTLEDYAQLKRTMSARRKTQSRYVSANLPENVREQSNGESAFRYFTNKIGEKGLYLLDEPENSLSPERQLELAGFLEDSVRFYGCQFVIATHSPFLLALRCAKIYDLDDGCEPVSNWTRLKNVRAYYDFFDKHREEFD